MYCILPKSAFCIYSLTPCRYAFSCSIVARCIPSWSSSLFTLSYSSLNCSINFSDIMSALKSFCIFWFVSSSFICNSFFLAFPVSSSMTSTAYPSSFLANSAFSLARLAINCVSVFCSAGSEIVCECRQNRFPLSSLLVHRQTTFFPLLRYHVTLR